MNNLVNSIKTMSESFFEEIKIYRRHLHQHPELSFKEYQTADFIESKLREMGGLRIFKELLKQELPFCLKDRAKGKI